MLKRLLVVITLVALTAGVVLAAGEQLENPVISSGGNVPTAEATGVQVHTIIGQPVIGVSLGGNVEAQLGALYGFGPVFVDEDGVPAGTVPLFISRNGNDIEITWEAIYQTPQIFMLAGNGEGVFSSGGNGWKRALFVSGIPGLPQPETPTVLDPAGHKMLHKNQIGGGSAEVYYKALQAGVSNPAGKHPGSQLTYLESALAVGKYNLSLMAGKNLISVPLLSQKGKSINAVFGQGAPWQSGDLVQYKFKASPAYYTAIYTAGGIWKDSANPANDPVFEIDEKFGNLVIVNTPKTITLLGAIANAAVEVPIFSGAGESTGGKTLLGIYYPVALGLEALSLVADGAAAGDLIQHKISAASEAYYSAFVSDGAWKNAANPAQPLPEELATLRPPRGYIFVRKQPSGFVWQRVKPY